MIPMRHALRTARWTAMATCVYSPHALTGTTQIIASLACVAFAAWCDYLAAGDDPVATKKRKRHVMREAAPIESRQLRG